MDQSYVDTGPGPGAGSRRVALERPWDHRRSYLIVLLTIAVFASGWFALLNLPRGMILLGSAELVMMVVDLALLWMTVRRPFARWRAVAFLIPLIVVVLMGCVGPDTAPTAFIWVMVLPVLFYALLGRRLGFLATVPLTLTAAAIYLWRFAGNPNMINEPTFGHLVLSYGTVWTFIHLYESNREAKTEQLRALATTDPLTGVNNRLQLDEVFERLASAGARSGEPLALLVLDLDHFKHINDRWGHQAGDDVLVHLARVLRGRMRGGDWAFRIGGEEFCLLMPGTSRTGAASAAQGLLRQIADSPCRVDGERIPLSASIGAAVYPDDGRRLDALLSLADQRMYRAKAEGRDRVVSA
ncbi:MAG: GGDEF domain-containing protein [Pseudomonadota bacterium]